MTRASPKGSRHRGRGDLAHTGAWLLCRSQSGSGWGLLVTPPHGQVGLAVGPRAGVLETAPGPGSHVAVPGEDGVAPDS